MKEIIGICSLSILLRCQNDSTHERLIVKQLYGKDQIKKPFDKFHAAFVLHHNYNRKSELYEIAHELAKNAASSDELQDEYQVQWLAKVTYDRWMLSIGKPQKFDTQGNIGISIE